MKDVYLQHMELTLKQMRKFNTPEAMYMLSEGLQGYRVLLERMGRVKVEPGGIGINREGKVMVWLS